MSGPGCPAPPTTAVLIKGMHCNGTSCTETESDVTVHVYPCRKGTMQSERESRRMSARLLTCTHTATGHTAGVLCVYATQNYLFSSSQGTH